MGSNDYGRLSRLRRGLAFAFFGLAVGCTNSGSNNTVKDKFQLPPPKKIDQSGVLPINSPAYNNLQPGNQQSNNQPLPGGATFNQFSPTNNGNSANSNNGVTSLPTTRISAPESARPDSRSAMSSTIGTPTFPTGNPASFNGPYNAQANPPIQPVGFNQQQQPAPQMQPLPGQQSTQSPQQNRVPAMNTLPSSNANSPAWPNPNGATNANMLPPLNPPTNWNAPTGNSPASMNPVPPAPPVGFNPAPTNSLPPMRLPESVSNKPISDPAIRQTGAIVPPLASLDPVPDNTPAPILAPPTKVISTFPPQNRQRDNVPPVVIGSDDIPPAPVVPR